MKYLIAKNLIVLMTLTASSLLAGGSASASTSPIWSDSVQSAAKATEHAKDLIIRTDDCKGLQSFLDFSTGSPDYRMSSNTTVSDLRSDMLQIEIAAATVQMASERQPDASAQEVLAQIVGMKNEVNNTLVTKLRFCGNGVERGPNK